MNHLPFQIHDLTSDAVFFDFLEQDSDGAASRRRTFRYKFYTSSGTGSSSGTSSNTGTARPRARARVRARHELEDGHELDGAKTIANKLLRGVQEVLDFALCVVGGVVCGV